MNERVFERFVGKIHRRWVLVRAAEYQGVCISIGCAVALPMVAVFLWRDQPVFLLLCLIGLICFLAAVAITIHRWPSILEAAGEADRQLELDDLLTTAMRLRGNSSDAMTDSMLAMADARCESVSPAAVILKRYGAPAWGGGALALAAVIAVSLIPAHPIRSAGAQEEERSILSDQGHVIGQSVISNVVGNSHEEAESEGSSRVTSVTELRMGGDLASTNNSKQASSPGDTALGKTTNSLAGVVAGGGASGNHGDVRGDVWGLGTSTARREVGAWESNGRKNKAGSVEGTGGDVPVGDRDLVKRYFDRN